MKYRLTGRTAWRALDGETIILDLQTKRMFGLNESAAFLWQTLEAVDDFEDMLQAMKGDRSASFGAADLEAFCQELVELGLLDQAEPEERIPAGIEPPADLEPPRVLWEETIERVAASCSFLPAEGGLCNTVPST